MPGTGDTICGDVRLEAEASASLGAAPLVPVFLARAGHSPERMWLLAIGSTFLPTSMDVSRFMAGANGLLGLRHPALARVVLVDREADDCVVGYEALPGAEPIADLAQRGDATPHLARAALEIARGLAFLHTRGLVHGAVAPGTVVMWEGVPVLMGYGLAALCVPDVFGPRSRKLGGDAVAPEIVAGEPFTPQADVFGWGAVLATIATGARGLEAVGPVSAGEIDVPGAEPILALARRALEPLPEDRPRDGMELLELLSVALAQAPAPGTIPPWLPRATDHDALQKLAARYLEEGAAAEKMRRSAAAPVRSAASDSGRIARVGLRKVESGPVGIVERRSPVAPVDTRVEAPSATATPRSVAAPRSALPTTVDDDDDDDELRFELDLDPEPEPTHDVDADAASRGKRRTPLPNVAPGGASPREPDTPAGWLRPSEKAPSDDPARTPGSHPRWPVAHDLGGGLRKRTFAQRGAQPGSPDAPIEDATPRDPVLAATPTPREVEASAAAAPSGERPSATPRTRDEPVVPEPLVDSDEEDPPTVPAGEATLPSLREPVRGVEPYRPPRMPGPHGPPAILLAVILAVFTGGLAVTATIRGVQARGSFSALWDEDSARTAVLAAQGGDAIVGGCDDDMVRLPTADVGEPLARVCVDVAEYPGWMEAPQTEVGFADAQRLCAQRGRRLCTTQEWRRACAGVEGRKWPYGDAAVVGRCRTAPAGDRSVGLSGGAAQCVTPEGAFDMVGNVAEWVAEGAVLGGNLATRNPTCATEVPGPADGAPRRGKAARGPIGLRCCADLR